MAEDIEIPRCYKSLGIGRVIIYSLQAKYLRMVHGFEVVN